MLDKDRRPVAKRKVEPETVADTKRIKQDQNEIYQRRLALPSVARRSADVVLSDIVDKVARGDRQVAGRLLREFALEHLSSISNNALTATNLLLEAIFKVRHDQVANLLLKYLKHVLSFAEEAVAKTAISRLLMQGTKLIGKSTLDTRILSLITDALERRTVRGEDIPNCILICATRSLHHTNNSQSRISAIQFLCARLFNQSHPKTADYEELEKTLIDVTTDRDSRVRLAAADGLKKFASAEHLSIKAYKIVKMLANDTDSQVRKLVLRILLSFALKYPMKELDGKMLLADDAFSAICHAINDMEVDVRAEAAVLLGEFEYISDHFLEQTLDKKLMRTMKTTGAVKLEKTSMFAMTNQSWVKPQAGQRWKHWKEGIDPNRKKTAKSSEWASGKDLNAPAPSNAPNSAEKDSEDSIIPQGACGAFVTALEDEFMSVRKGAVYSLGKLAAHRPFFAGTALEHLTDMFNDEIADVRLDAILALTPLVVHGQLLKEQLAVMLKCLDDAMFESRQALRELLGKGEFADAECMDMTTKALLNCLQRFPGDREMIFQCLSQLGSKHGVFVHTMIDSLLDLHPIFEPQEQVVDNVFYLARIILILSAATNYEPIISLLPTYVQKHYRFMRASAPHLVSPIRTLDERFALNSNVPASFTNGEVKAEILGQTYMKLLDSFNPPTLQERNQTREFVSSDAEAICNFNTVLAGAAQFLNVLTDLLATTDSLEENIIRGGDLSRVQDLLIEATTTALGALRLFAGLDDAIKAFLEALIFHLRMLASLAKLMCCPEAYAAIILEVREVCAESRSQLASVKTPLPSHQQAMSEILHVVDVIGYDEKKYLSSSKLAEILNRTSPKIPTELDRIEKVKVKWAQITSPDRQIAMERPIKFIAGYPTVVEFVAQLHHFSAEDIADVRVQIDYPDQTRSFFKPRPADFSHTQGTEVYTLSTKTLLQSAMPWSTAASVKLSIVMLSAGRVELPLAVMESIATRRPAMVAATIKPVARM